MSTKKASYLRAVVLAGGVGAALGLGGLCATAASAAPVPSKVAASETAGPAATIARLSVATGSQLGGTRVTVSGADLASLTGGDEPQLSRPTISLSITPGGKGSTPVSIAVDPESVEVVSKRLIRFTAPPSPVTGAATLTITDGVRKPAVKAAAFAYTAAAPQLDQPAEGEVTAEAGGTITVRGEYLGDSKTKVAFGGKPATEVKVVVDPEGPDSLTARVASGFVDEQDVVVTTTGGAVDAGIIRATATVPVISDDALPAVSVEKGATFTISGEALDVVTGGTFTDADKKALKVTTAAVKTTVNGKPVIDPTKLTVTIPKGAKDGLGSLALTTKYTTSEPVELAVAKAGAPKLNSADLEGLGVDGGTVGLAGENLRFVTSVTVNKVAVKPGSYQLLDGTALLVPVTAPTKLPAVVPVTVVTDGGTASYNVPFTNTKLEGASYNPVTKTISLYGANLKNLSAIKVLDAQKKPVSATFTAATGGQVSVSAPIKAGLAEGAYTVTATDASTTTFSASFKTTGAAVGAVSWSYPYITVTGAKLDQAVDWYYVEPGEEEEMHIGLEAAYSEDGTKATLLLPDPQTKEYTVVGVFVDEEQEQEQSFTVKVKVTDPGVTASKVAYDTKAQLLTITGTRTGDYFPVLKLTPAGSDNGFEVDLPYSEDATTASAHIDLPAGKYSVSVLTHAEDEPVQVAALPLTVASPVSVKLAKASTDGTNVAVDGAGLDKVVTVDAVAETGERFPLTVKAQTATYLSTVTEEPLPAGDFTLALRDKEGVLVITGPFTVAAPAASTK